jgi:hypothetical protein
MTLFGTTTITHGNVMPTFKVQDEVNHLTGFIFNSNQEEPMSFSCATGRMK